MSRADLTNLLSASPDEVALSRACAALERGKEGPDQPKWMRDGGMLRKLEEAALAEYVESGKGGRHGGWRLTEAGKLQAKRFLAAGRAARGRP